MDKVVSGDLYLNEIKDRILYMKSEGMFSPKELEKVDTFIFVENKMSIDELLWGLFRFKSFSFIKAMLTVPLRCKGFFADVIKRISPKAIMNIIEKDKVDGVKSNCEDLKFIEFKILRHKKEILMSNKEKRVPSSLDEISENIRSEYSKYQKSFWSKFSLMQDYIIGPSTLFKANLSASTELLIYTYILVDVLTFYIFPDHSLAIIISPRW